MFRKGMFVSLLLLVLAVFLAGCGQGSAPKEQAPPKGGSGSSSTQPAPAPTGGQQVSLRWGTITAGGAWQVIGAAMLEDIVKANPNITGSTMPSNTTANVMGVHDGKFNVGFSLADTTADAWQGTGYFKDKGQIRDIREVAALYPQTTHLLVPADSPIKTIEDLKGKKVSPGAKGLSSDLEFQRLLKLYGMSYDDLKVEFLSFDDAAQQMLDGHLDALAFITVPPPFAPVINISAQKPIRLISIPDDKIAEMAKFQGVQAYTMPPGTYKGIDYPVKGIATRSHIIVREDMPEDVVYAMVKTIAENFGRYGDVLASMKYVKAEEMATDVGIPLHPGALKYYKERGWVK